MLLPVIYYGIYVGFTCYITGFAMLFALKIMAFPCHTLLFKNYSLSKNFLFFKDALNWIKSDIYKVTDFISNKCCTCEFVYQWILEIKCWFSEKSEAAQLF